MLRPRARSAWCISGTLRCERPRHWPKKRDHLQAEFAMRQRPAPFFFRSIPLMKARTVRLDTLTNYQGQFPQAGQHGDGAMAVIGHPQRLATVLTTLFEWGQYLLLRRFGTRSSASHLLAPTSKGQHH